MPRGRKPLAHTDVTNPRPCRYAWIRSCSIKARCGGGWAQQTLSERQALTFVVTWSVLLTVVGSRYLTVILALAPTRTREDT